MAGDLRRDIALDLQAARRCCAAPARRWKTWSTRVQRPPAQFQRGDGIVEARRLGIGRDGRNLGLVLGKRARIGRAEMLGPDAVEGRNPVGGGPGGEEADFPRRRLGGWVMVIGRSYQMQVQA